MHVASGCASLAKQQKVRHNAGRTRVHWQLCRKYRTDCNKMVPAYATEVSTSTERNFKIP